MYICIYAYTYIYIYRERERDNVAYVGEEATGSRASKRAAS